MSTPRKRALGFGFDPDVSPHHFVVTVKRDGTAAIVERHVYAPEDAHAPPGELKARLDAYRWGRVAEVVANEFNRRLYVAGGRRSGWKTGETLLAAHFGKELTLLAWAVEDADPTLLPNMLANWLGLAPEERWWLYTTVNATSGHPEHDRAKGWRKAIKIALAENPLSEPPRSLASAPLPVSEEDRRTSAASARKRTGRARARAEAGEQMALGLPAEEGEP